MWLVTCSYVPRDPFLRQLFIAAFLFSFSFHHFSLLAVIFLAFFSNYGDDDFSVGLLRDTTPHVESVRYS